jgi:membrane protease YdiL (CAAX protease family)
MMFFLGLTCAIAYQRTGSLWASVVVHGSFNILAIVLLYAALASGMQIPGM